MILVNIGEASRYLEVSIETLHAWEERGELVPIRTEGQHRRYDAAVLQNLEVVKRGKRLVPVVKQNKEAGD